MSTAGRYVGAYRIPATEDVKGLLEKVANEKYFEQELRDEATSFLSCDRVPYPVIQKLCTAVREKEGVHGPWLYNIASLKTETS